MSREGGEGPCGGGEEGSFVWQQLCPGITVNQGEKGITEQDVGPRRGWHGGV